MSKKTQENKELAAVWTKLNELEQKIQKTGSEEQQLAANASRAASGYKNKTEETKKQAENLLKELIKIKNEIELNKSTIDDITLDISEKSLTANSDFELLKSELAEIEKKKTELVNLIEQLNKFFEENPEIEEKVENLNSYLTNSTENSTKISQVLKNAITRKSELDKIYFEIMGSEEKNEETGETTQIEGKKDELETAYSDLSERLNNFKKQLSEHQVSSLKSFDEVKTDWEQKFVVLEKEIQELLPNALTAGLSHAYSIKKELEEKSSIELEKKFKNSIYGLIGISLIPLRCSSTASPHNYLSFNYDIFQ